MAITALQAANIFIQKGKDAEKPLTQLQVQKMIYFLHGWGYAILGERFIEEDPEAWQFGPFYPQVWENLKDWDAMPIKETIKNVRAVKINGQQERNLIDSVYKFFSQYSGMELVKFTHSEGTPWHDVYVKRKNKKSVISEELMQKHFVSLHEEYQKKHAA